MMNVRENINYRRTKSNEVSFLFAAKPKGQSIIRGGAVAVSGFLLPWRFVSALIAQVKMAAHARRLKTARRGAGTTRPSIQSFLNVFFFSRAFDIKHERVCFDPFENKE